MIGLTLLVRLSAPPAPSPHHFEKTIFVMSVREELNANTQRPDATTSVVHSAGHAASPDSEVTPRVLLVEDDKALRRYLQVLLEQAGYEVIQAADGLEGMKLALASSVDIVVTDAMMPNLSGQEFCRFLRNSPSLSHIPIVILSGSEPQHGFTSRELADAFLSKPVSATEFIDCLKGLLGREK